MKESWFHGKTAMVTGGGRGIGKACALAFARAGAAVVVVSRTGAQLEEVAREVRERTSGKALAFEGDISDERSVERLFAKARETFGPVHCLVNNAATFQVAPVIEHSVADWDRVMAVNVRGVFLCSRELLKQAKGGSIVNISSLAGVQRTEKFKGLASYVASKFAVVGLTEALAVEGRETGVRVNCIAPGAVDTEMLRQAAPHLKTKTSPDDIARTVLVLCDESQSRHLSGSTIEIYSNL